MKTMIVFVVDAGTSMSNDLSEKSISKLSLALGIISSYITTRMLTSKTIEFGVVTYGVEVTNNYLNLNENNDMCHNVNEVIEMNKPNTNTLRKIAALDSTTKSNIKGDMIDGITVGLDILERANVNKKYNRILILLNDASQILQEVIRYFNYINI